MDELQPQQSYAATPVPMTPPVVPTPSHRSPLIPGLIVLAVLVALVVGTWATGIWPFSKKVSVGVPPQQTTYAIARTTGAPYHCTFTTPAFFGESDSNTADIQGDNFSVQQSTYTTAYYVRLDNWGYIWRKDADSIDSDLKFNILDIEKNVKEATGQDYRFTDLPLSFTSPTDDAECTRVDSAAIVVPSRTFTDGTREIAAAISGEYIKNATNERQAVTTLPFTPLLAEIKDYDLHKSFYLPERISLQWENDNEIIRVEEMYDGGRPNSPICDEHFEGEPHRGCVGQTPKGSMIYFKDTQSTSNGVRDPFYYYVHVGNTVVKFQAYQKSKGEYSFPAPPGTPPEHFTPADGTSVKRLGAFFDSLHPVTVEEVLAVPTEYSYF